MSTIPSTIPSTSSGTLPGAGATDGSKTSKDYLDFLNLLTVQLKNQDPTNPMDTTQFTQQLIGFSQIQQQVETNTNLKSLLEQSKTANVSNAVSYIDRFVKVDSDKFNLTNNSGYISYNLPASATNVKVSITDSSGRVLNTFAGATSVGSHDYTWNGLDANGNKLTDGTYNFNVSAVDGTGVAIDGITTSTTGLVTSVDLENGDTTLHMGELAFTTDKVVAIEGSYATTPTEANPGTVASAANVVTNAISNAAGAVSDVLSNL